jgi:EAL domain-containing protein (putative c-di-GMP-specific phosphodiesterase class I)
MYDEAEENRLLEQDVREALGGDGLALAYQPIIDSATGAVVAREACFVGGTQARRHSA